MKANRQPWICPECGTPANTDGCPKCFRDRPSEAPVRNAPGSYFSIIYGEIGLWSLTRKLATVVLVLWLLNSVAVWYWLSSLRH